MPEVSDPPLYVAVAAPDEVRECKNTTALPV
jgi:hypothetical protein